MNTKKIVIGIIVIIVLITVGYLVFGSNTKISTVDKTDNGVTSVVNKSDIALKINDTTILKTTYETQFATTIASLKAQNIDATSSEILSKIKNQVLNDIINNELLSQAIIKAGIKPSSEEVEKEFQNILKQAGGVKELNTELVKNNLTEAKLRENISKQLAIQTYLLQNIDTKLITASNDEIKTFYADYSKAQKNSGQKTIPPLTELTVQIQQQIILNKQQLLVNNFMASLREKAKIEIFI